jgi:hypothetical protein
MTGTDAARLTDFHRRRRSPEQIQELGPAGGAGAGQDALQIVLVHRLTYRRQQIRLARHGMGGGRPGCGIIALGVPHIVQCD